MIKSLGTLFILFFILTPGIFWSYAKKTNKYFIALLHAAIFAFIWSFIQPQIREGLKESTSLEFKLEKNMKTDKDVEKLLKKNFKKATVNYDNADGNNVLIVTVKEGGQHELDITKDDIKNPKKNIDPFITKKENKKK